MGTGCESRGRAYKSFTGFAVEDLNKVTIIGLYRQNRVSLVSFVGKELE